MNASDTALAAARDISPGVVHVSYVYNVCMLILYGAYAVGGVCTDNFY
jgi:hypothetical protein